jgi:hypothetical protein
MLIFDEYINRFLSIKHPIVLNLYAPDNGSGIGGVPGIVPIYEPCT